MDTRKLGSFQHKAHSVVHIGIVDENYRKVATMKMNYKHEDTHMAAEMVRRWNEYPKQRASIEKAEKAAVTLAFRMIEAEHALREAIKGLEFAMQRDPDQAGTYDAAATRANLFLQTIKA